MKNPINKKRVIHVGITLIIIVSIFAAFNFINLDRKPKIYGEVYTESIHLTTETGGNLLHLYGTEGAALKKGDAIALFENDAITQEVHVLEIALEKAQKEVELQRALYELDSSAIQLKKVELSVLLVKEVQYKLDQAQLKLQKLTFVAPTDGILSAIYYQVGERVPPSAPIGVMERLEAQYVDYFIGYEHLNDFTTGQPVTLYASDRVFSANIVYVDHKSTFTPMNLVSTEDYERLVYKIKIKLNTTDTLYDGLLLEWKVGDYYAK